METEIPRDGKESRDCGHRETEGPRHGLRNRERGTRRLVGGKGAGGTGWDWGSPYLSPALLSLLAWLPLLLPPLPAWALEEVTAGVVGGGGARAGQGTGGGELWGRDPERGPVACECHRHSRSHGRAVTQSSSQGPPLPRAQSLTLSHPAIAHTATVTRPRPVSHAAPCSEPQRGRAQNHTEHDPQVRSQSNNPRSHPESQSLSPTGGWSTTATHSHMPGAWTPLLTQEHTHSFPQSW